MYYHQKWKMRERKRERAIYNQLYILPTQSAKGEVQCILSCPVCVLEKSRKTVRTCKHSAISHVPGESDRFLGKSFFVHICYWNFCWLCWGGILFLTSHYLWGKENCGLAWNIQHADTKPSKTWIVLRPASLTQ